MLSTSHDILSNIVLSRLIRYSDKFTGDNNVDFDVIGQRLIKSSISVRHWRRSGSIMVQYISYLYISRKSLILS
jgi:hypothetical protein